MLDTTQEEIKDNRCKLDDLIAKIRYEWQKWLKSEREVALESFQARHQFNLVVEQILNRKRNELLIWLIK